jgi:glycosyl transferase, family 25
MIFSEPLWCALAHQRHHWARIPEYLFACERCGREWRNMDVPRLTTGDAMIPAFVINLKESVARCKHMKNEMTKAEIPFAFVEAVNGKGITQTWGTVTRNETACALSHLHAIGLIAKGEVEFGAIFEDDIVISPETRQFLDINALRMLPRFDIMQLCDLGTRSALAMTVARLAGERRHIIRARPRPSMGMQASIYHRDAARRIVREINQISAPIDEMLFSRAAVFGLRIVSVRPAVVLLADFQSTINAQRPKPGNKIKRELARGVNFLKRGVNFSAVWRATKSPPWTTPQRGRTSS